MPKTTLGFRRTIICQLCAQARNKLKGNSNFVSQPLPRKPPNWTDSKLNPRAGTRVCSIPLALPNHATCHPRLRNSSATAKPGKIWPPVPPAMTTMEGFVTTSLRALKLGFHNQFLVITQRPRHSSKCPSPHS